MTRRRAVIHRAAAGGRGIKYCGGGTQAKYPTEGRDLLTMPQQDTLPLQLQSCSLLATARSRDLLVAAVCRGRLGFARNPSDLYDYPQKSLTNCVGGTGSCPRARTSPSGGLTRYRHHHHHQLQQRDIEQFPTAEEPQRSSRLFFLRVNMKLHPI